MTILPNGVEIEVCTDFYNLEGSFEEEGLGSHAYTSDKHSNHMVFICSICGDIWARIFTTVEGKPSELYTLMTRLCRIHGDGSLVEWQRPINVILELPRRVLERELELYHENENWVRTNDRAETTAWNGLSTRTGWAAIRNVLHAARRDNPKQNICECHSNSRVRLHGS